MNVDLSLRIKAFLVDYTIFVAIVVFPVIYFFASVSFGILFIGLFIFAFLYFCIKDTIKGRSIGKLIVGTAVRTIHNTTIPAIFKLIIRNIFTLIWPIELIYLIRGKSSRKIGDVLAGTDVYRISKAKPSDITKR